MPPFDTDDGLVLTEEGSSCRARGGALNYLFRNSTEERVRTDYLRSRDFACCHFDRLPDVPEAGRYSLGMLP